MKFWIAQLTLLYLIAFSSTARAESASDCYDVVVKAHIVRQIPSVPADCGKGCIVMVWPWFLHDAERAYDAPADVG